MPDYAKNAQRIRAAFSLRRFLAGHVKAQRVERDRSKMGLTKNILAAISLASLICGPLRAQDDSDKINSNIGAAVSLPLSPTSHFVNTSWGLIGGAGYNFSPHHSVIGEFMWSALYPSEASLQPIRVALNDNTVTGHSNLYAVTGNYDTNGKANDSVPISSAAAGGTTVRWVLRG